MTWERDVNRSQGFARERPGRQPVPAAATRGAPAAAAPGRDDEIAPEFAIRPARPLVQMALRGFLWGAVLLGAAGGMLGLLRDPEVVEAQEPVQDQDWIVPAPAAGFAELVVEEWLVAGAEDRARLEPLFAGDWAEHRDSYLSGQGSVDVTRVVAVGGWRETEDYWTVTIRADIAGDAATGDGAGATGAGDPEGGESAAAEDQTVPEGEESAGTADGSSWYLQLGVVGDGEGSFLALSAPSVMPPPAAPVASWEVGVPAEVPDSSDELALTVEEFLSALLAGQGSVDRYVAAGVEVEVVSPAPFTEVVMEQVAREDREDGGVWVLVDVMAETPSGVRIPLSYDLVLHRSSGRWEVGALSGAPTLIERNEP